MFTLHIHPLQWKNIPKLTNMNPTVQSLFISIIKEFTVKNKEINCLEQSKKRIKSI